MLPLTSSELHKPFPISTKRPANLVTLSKIREMTKNLVSQVNINAKNDVSMSS